MPAQSRFVEVPSISGRAQVLVTGEGPAVPMVIGGAIPAVFWAPLMAELSGHTRYAIELPGNGLTDRARYHHTTFRSTAVAYLADILDALEIGPFASSVLPGVGHDAAYVAQHIHHHASARAAIAS